MNKKKLLLNILCSFIPQIVNIVIAIFTRRYLIMEVGNEANGLYQLFLSITGIISVVELGIGSGIIYCLYEPIAKNQIDKVSGLYYYFKKTYLIIGVVIFGIGLAVTPFLPYLAKDYTLNENIYYCYVISLVFTFLPYLFTYKLHLINAYKDNYISGLVTGLGLSIQYVIQIIFLVVFKSLSGYMWAKVIGVLVEWVTTEIVFANYKKAQIIKTTIDYETKKKVSKYIKAMFTCRIGYTLISTTDSLIISTFVSVTILGFYSNYISLASTLYNVLVLFLTPATSIIGNIYVTRKNEVHKYLSFFHTLNFIIGFVFYLGYYAVIDNAIMMFYSSNGEQLLLARSTVAVLAINLYIQYLRQAITVFKDATGAYYIDRWRPLFEGVVNIILDIVFVKLIGITGVFIATIITNVLISDIVEPYVLERKILNHSPKTYYIKNYIFIGIFAAAVYLFDFITPSNGSDLQQFFIRGFIAVGFSSAICLIFVIFDKNFRALSKEYVSYFIQKFKHKES